MRDAAGSAFLGLILLGSESICSVRHSSATTDSDQHVADSNALAAFLLLKEKKVSYEYASKPKTACELRRTKQKGWKTDNGDQAGDSSFWVVSTETIRFDQLCTSPTNTKMSPKGAC